MAAQDGVIKTNAHVARVQCVSTSPQCRLCGSQETLGHILSCCKIYQWTLYKERHDRVLYQLVKAVTKSLGLMLPNRPRGAGGVVKSGVMGTAAKRILIDQATPTDKVLEHRRPDLTVRLAGAAGSRNQTVWMQPPSWDPSTLRACIVRCATRVRSGNVNIQVKVVTMFPLVNLQKDHYRLVLKPFSAHRYLPRGRREKKLTQDEFLVAIKEQLKRGQLYMHV